MKNINNKIKLLIKKGVSIPNPESVVIGDEVDIERISGDGVSVYSGCKIFGSSTLVLQGSNIGYEGPVTIENCQIGPEVKLKNGFYKQSVFLSKVSMGSGSHVRDGTILEEQASVAHTVGLKQTILFPFVTLGSLINFCDCFMSGGTDRKNHSEVGSSYIHFNYTPNQDKATASLIGDVPNGVMLNKNPIFLGGQGGLIGPCRLAYGTIIAAGTINRKDELNPGRLIFGGVGKGGSVPFTPGVYRSEKRIVINNIIYIANLMALLQWYNHVRSMFISHDFPQSLLDGLKEKLNMAIKERVKRLGELCLKMPDPDIANETSERLMNQKNELRDRWPEMEEVFKTNKNKEGDLNIRDLFLETINREIKMSGKNYIPVIKSLSVENTTQGTKWLQGIVDNIIAQIIEIMPTFNGNSGR
jgi:bifunctional UDP-N-acetylglucosamine pyrophosphorylase / glucosamine-1-phosphate N-acetyltransferase